MKNFWLSVLAISSFVLVLAILVLVVTQSCDRIQKYANFCEKKCQQLYAPTCYLGRMVNTKANPPLVTCECYYSRDSLTVDTARAAFVYQESLDDQN